MSCRAISNAGNEPPSDFSSESLGKQEEGTSVSPVLEELSMERKGNCKEPHEPAMRPSLTIPSWGQLSNCKL